MLEAWDFTQAQDLLGWAANEHIADAALRDGALRGRPVDWDPIVTSPPLEFKTSPTQRIEITMSSEQGGTAELFYAVATEGKYGGFEPEARLTFDVRAGTEPRRYVLLPHWHGTPVVYRLRLDPPGSPFAIYSVRIVEGRSTQAAAAEPDWRFAERQSALGWQDVHGEGRVAATAEGLRVEGSEEPVLLESPAPLVDPRKREWLSVRLRAAAETAPATRLLDVTWVASDHPRQARRAAEIVFDGRWHNYVLNLGGPAWWGEIRALYLTLPAAPGATYEVAQVAVTELPSGPPELKLAAFGAEDGLNRVGRPVRLTATATNLGGETAPGATATLTLPDGRTLRQELPELPYGVPAPVALQAACEEPMQGPATLTVQSPGCPPAQATSPLRVLPALEVARADYVPQPQPAATDYEIGVYYYPGWWDYGRWDPVRQFPERKPVLGWYREGDPEVADWQTKYAAEHGVRYFAFDWYWRDRKLDIGHALHDGYLRSRYKGLVQFCLLYANHPPFNIADRDDLMAITDFWLEQYFLRPEYYKIGGKPVVIMFNPPGLEEVLGGEEGVAAAFAEMRQRAQARGLPGLYLAACVGDNREACERCRREGYYALTAYNYPAANTRGQRYSPYSWMVDGFPPIWDAIMGYGALPYLLPTSPGWDPRPWHGPDTTVRTDSSPAEFRRMLLAAKQRVDAAGPQVVPNSLIIEAWNEWGEGSICEPAAGYGFDYLDVVREVFCAGAGDHQDLSPRDVGRPYLEWPEPPVVMTWRFGEATDTLGWRGGGMEGLRVEGGALRGRTVTNDPALVGPDFVVLARDCNTLVIRMSAGADTDAQLFWQLRSTPEFSEGRSFSFPVTGDGQVHEYRVPLADQPLWFGEATRLRFDPVAAAGVELAIEEIAFAGP